MKDVDHTQKKRQETKEAHRSNNRRRLTVVYSQPSMVQYTHQVHKVVSFTVHIISNRQQLFIHIRVARQDRGGAPNRLTQFTAKRLMATPDIGGCSQPERLLLEISDTTLARRI